MHALELHDPILIEGHVSGGRHDSLVGGRLGVLLKHITNVILDNSKVPSLQFQSLSQSLQFIDAHDLLSEPFNVIKNAVPSNAVVLSCDERSKSLAPDLRGLILLFLRFHLRASSLDE